MNPFAPPARSLATLLGPPPAVPLGKLWAEDGVGMRYQFTVYNIDASPAGVRAVYVFARYQAGTYVPVYIGRATILSERLAGHERRAEAKRRGANRLLVHIPGPRDPVSFEEAERRLIRCYTPPLNDQLNPRPTLLGR